LQKITTFSYCIHFCPAYDPLYSTGIIHIWVWLHVTKIHFSSVSLEKNPICCWSNVQCFQMRVYTFKGIPFLRGMNQHRLHSLTVPGSLILLGKLSANTTFSHLFPLMGAFSLMNLEIVTYKLAYIVFL
jgi:hypothetical protein